MDGAFTKAIVVQLVRKVEGKQFYEVPLSLPFLRWQGVEDCLVDGQ